MTNQQFIDLINTVPVPVVLPSPVPTKKVVRVTSTLFKGKIKEWTLWFNDQTHQSTRDEAELDRWYDLYWPRKK